MILRSTATTPRRYVKYCRVLLRRCHDGDKFITSRERTGANGRRQETRRRFSSAQRFIEGCMPRYAIIAPGNSALHMTLHNMSSYLCRSGFARYINRLPPPSAPCFSFHAYQAIVWLLDCLTSAFRNSFLDEKRGNMTIRENLATPLRPDLLFSESC